MEECRKAGERSETERQRALELRFSKLTSPENLKIDFKKKKPDRVKNGKTVGLKIRRTNLAVETSVA